MNEVKVRYIKDNNDFFDVNDELAGIVPMALPNEQAALNKDIFENGQREPIVLWHGKIVDGRCRQNAIKTMGLSRIDYKELDDNLSEDDVKIYVKSVNTRRNLTMTQKIIIACKESLKPNSASVNEIAKQWGISFATLKNARYIAKMRPQFIEPLFNGKSVVITGSDGIEKDSNKVSTIYASIKREEENSKEDEQHGWKEDAYIITQAGKEWYYNFIKDKKYDIETKMALAELANYKFKIDFA